MAAAVTMRTDFTADALRRLAKVSKDANQSRRLLSLAAVLDGMSRSDAARIGGMDRQTLRDWVHVQQGRFRRPSGCLVGRTRTAPVARTEGRTGRDGGDRAGLGGWRGPPTAGVASISSAS